MKFVVKNYLSLIKFSHTIFALPFAVIGYLLGLRATGVSFDALLFLKVLLCMVFARSAAMAFNRYIDREIDKKNPRTFVREIPSGVIKANNALAFVMVNVFLFMLTTWFINPICFYLSPIAVIVVLGYSYTKRFTALCHMVLGVGLALAPIGAYLAVTGKFAWLPLFYSFAVICWVSGFDIIYALQDEAFDKGNHLNSIPVKLGTHKSLWLSSFLHFLSAIFIVVPYFFASFGYFYLAGCIVFIALLIYQHSLVKSDDLSKVNIAFFTTNGIASVLFACFFIANYFWG